MSTGGSDSAGGTDTEGGTTAGSVSASSTSGNTTGTTAGTDSAGTTDGSGSSGSTTGLPPECGDGIPDEGVICHVAVDVEASFSQAVTFADLNGDDHLDVVWAGAFPCPSGEGGTHAHAVPGFSQAPDVVHEGAYIGFAGWAVGDGSSGPTPADAQLFDVNAPVRALAPGNVAGDASTDLVVVEDDGLVVAVGDGAGGLVAGAVTALQVVPGSWGFADMSGDGLLDVVVSPGMGVGPAASVDVWISDGNGSFTAQINAAVGPAVVDLAVDDVDGDGDVDVLTLREDGLQIYLGDGTGALVNGPTTAPMATTPLALALTDVHDDGVLDAVAGYEDSDSVWLYTGDGSGSFSGPTGHDAGAPVWSLAGAQLDAGAPLDVFAFAQGGEASGLFGSGDGLSAADPTSLVAYGRASVGDLNEDGIDDLAMQGGGQVRLLVSNP